jgi:hypothetical protein
MLYDCFYLYQFIIEGRKERLRGINVEFENNDEKFLKIISNIIEKLFLTLSLIYYIFMAGFTVYINSLPLSKFF